MTITVQLFAAARELAGAGEVAVEAPAGGTVRAVRAAPCARAPKARRARAAEPLRYRPGISPR